MPIVEQASCQGRAGVQIVLANQFEQLLARHRVLYQREFHHIHIAVVVKGVVGIVDVGHTARHACSEVATRLAQHHHAAAGHILATVVASALDDGNSTRVAHTEAFAHLSVDVQFATGGAVESCVAGNDVLFRLEVVVAPTGRQYRDASATESLAEIVVALALQLDVETANGESAKRLSGRAFELDIDGIGRQTGFAILFWQ